MATLAQDSGHVVMQAPMQTPSASSGGIPTTTSIDSVFLLGETSARMYLNQTTTANHDTTTGMQQYSNYQEPVINHHTHHDLSNAIILENQEFGNTDLPNNNSSSLLSTEVADVVPTSTPPLTEMTTLPSMFSTTPQSNNVDILAHSIEMTFQSAEASIAAGEYRGANGGDDMMMLGGSHVDVDNYPIIDYNQTPWSTDNSYYPYNGEWYF